jgi:hypothetical protein
MPLTVVHDTGAHAAGSVVTTKLFFTKLPSLQYIEKPEFPGYFIIPYRTAPVFMLKGVLPIGR